jgi:hypothetical protein
LQRIQYRWQAAEPVEISISRGGYPALSLKNTAACRMVYEASSAKDPEIAESCSARIANLKARWHTKSYRRSGFDVPPINKPIQQVASVASVTDQT